MSALGKLGKGKRKALSQEERWRRAQRLASVRGRRWLKCQTPENNPCI
jgi:hypothetical protein